MHTPAPPPTPLTRRGRGFASSADGPSGVLICAENFVIYKKEGHPDVRAVIPRRSDLPGDRGVLIVSHATHKLKAGFFFLLQVP